MSDLTARPPWPVSYIAEALIDAHRRINELRDEIEFHTYPQEPAMTTIYDHLIGTHVLLRTYVSGVSVGTLIGVEESAAGWAIRLDDGIRVWSWEGGGLACSDLARVGVKGGKREGHPDGIVITASQGMELIPVSDEAWVTFQVTR